jgi:hypothetical protein
MGVRVPLALAEEEEGGSEMERLEKSSMAFFAGLSLISSPGNTAGKKSHPASNEWKFDGTKGREKGSSQKASGRVCEGLRLTRTTMGFPLAAGSEAEASPAGAAADAMAGG